jgi:hypothetical protein
MKIFPTALLALIALPAIASASSLSYDVQFNTSGLSAGGSYFLDFQFIGSNGNTVDLDEFSYGGGSGPAGPIEMDTITNFFNEVTDPFTAGGTLNFQVSTTNIAPPAGGFPDELSIFILDGSQNPLTTLDPADAYFYFDVNGGSPDIQTFSGSGVGAPSIAPAAPPGVPEPGTMLTMVMGLGLAALKKWPFRKG